MSYRTTLRNALVCGCTAGLLVGSGLLAMPAQAAQVVPTHAVVVRPMITEAQAIGQALTFFSDYRNAKLGIGGDTPTEVKENYLSGAAETQVLLYQTLNLGKDGVFHSTNIPASATAVGVGETSTAFQLSVDETFSTGGHVFVLYEVRKADVIIDKVATPS